MELYFHHFQAQSFSINKLFASSFLYHLYLKFLQGIAAFFELVYIYTTCNAFLIRMKGEEQDCQVIDLEYVKQLQQLFLTGFAGKLSRLHLHDSRDALMLLLANEEDGHP